MAKAQTPQNHEEDAMKDHIRGKFEKMFPDQELPTYASISEVETMKNRIQELEAKLKRHEARAVLAKKEAYQNEKPSEVVQLGRSAHDGIPFSNSTGLARFWAWVTEAHPSITGVRERNSARLAASFLFIIMLLEIVGAFARVPQLGLVGALTGASMIALYPTLLAYGLSRTKWYRAAIFLFALFFASFAYITMIRDGAGADISTLVLVYVPLSLIVASTFLSSWAVLLLVGLNLGAFFLTTRFGVLSTLENFGAQSGIIITLGMVLISLAHFRKRSEEQTLQEIKTVNEELQAANTELTVNREKLEQRVSERTHDLELASEVGRSVSEKIGDLTEMLSQSVELIRAKYELYYSQIYLMDASGRRLVLRAGTGEAGTQLLSRGHQLEISAASLNGRAASDRHPIIVADTQKSANFLPNPLLPLTRSELAVPLIVNEKVVGVLDMQSEKPDTFGETNLPAFQVLASQLAIAIQNATLFNQTEEARLRVEEQARRLTSSGWHDFMNAIERSETIGYLFNQNEILPLPEMQNTPYENTLVIPIQAAGVTIGEVQLADEADRTWTTTEKEIVQATVSRIGQHIENLRLLAQAEGYRSDAEQAARRLTREGWEAFLKNRKDLESGYIYDLNQVRSLTKNHNGSHPVIAQPIMIQAETMGELAVETEVNQEAAEIVAAVAAQLSEHIENLRLLEQTQERSLELEETQTFLDSVVESLPHMLFVKEAESLRFIRWNKAAEQLVGFSEKEMLGKNDHDFFPKDDADFFTAKDREVLNSGKTLDIPEESLATVHQGTRYMHTRKAPIYGADGKPKYLLGVAEDITERKKAEETLRVSEARLSEALNIAKLANWEYDFVNDIFTFNDQFYEILGTTAEQEGGYTMPAARYAERFVHPEDIPVVGAEIQKAVETTDPNYSVQVDHRVIFGSGEIGYFNVRFQIEKDANGRTIRSYGANQNITERKRGEEAMAKRATELATVAQVSTTASTVLDPDELLQAVVDLAKAQFGLYHVHIYLADESWNTLLLAAGAGEVGRKMVTDGWNIPIDHEQSIVATAARIRESVIANDVIRDRDSSFLSNQLLPDTRSEMAVPMIVGQQLVGVFDVQADKADHFTEEDANIYTTLAAQVAVALQNARLYKEQAATVTKLRELDKLKLSFLANMSHELRTPLNSILGFTDVMMEGLDGPLTEYMDNDLRLIQKNGQHLLHLINDVLDMAKIDAGRMNLNPETFKAFEVMEEVTSITSTLANEKKLSLSIDEAADRNIAIYADRTRLRQVMINLVNNSIKFTEKGEVVLNVSPMEGGRLLISVRDTGLGIPPEKLEAVFQEFTQVDSSTTRKAGGTGLGLPISRRLVDMHGGRLWADSTGIPGEGSVFFVELPLEARITEVVEKQEK